jgi:hypothetical protein
MKEKWEIVNKWEHDDGTNKNTKLKMNDDDLKILKELKRVLEHPEDISSDDSDDSDNSDENDLEEEEENEEDIEDEDDFENDVYESDVYEGDFNTTAWFGCSGIKKTVLARERPSSENFEEAIILNVIVSHGLSYVTLKYRNGCKKDIRNVESNFKEFVTLNNSDSRQTSNHATQTLSIPIH